MTATDLPLQLTSFIGRERELADVRRLIANHRLVTITGPGGSGKTRLALEVAKAVAGDFSDGVRFVSLAAVSDPTFFIPAITQALRMVESPDELPLDSLKAFLQRRQMLLLLDNFEQIIAAAPLLTELLRAAPELKLLLTSREALRLRGEQAFPLPPLPLFAGVLSADKASAEKLRQVPSIALFVERARAGHPDLALTDENAAVVAEICARLDGLPLAIELAAARIKLLPPWALLALLEESPLQLLTVGPRDLPARQQTLTATVQWSYDLLDAGEQSVFRALSVFVGGCTLAAAMAVAGAQPAHPGNVAADDESAPPREPHAMLDLLSSLVDKNLLRQSERDREVRLSMLATIREFGLQRLAALGELESIQWEHARYFLALAEEAEPHLTGPEQKAWLQKLEREQDNLRAALTWGFARQRQGGPADLPSAYVLRLAGALWRFWFLRGRFAEGRRWLEQALDAAAFAGASEPADRALQAKLFYAAATIIRRQNDLALARTLCAQSIALYRELGENEGLVAARLQLIRIRDLQGDYDDIDALLEGTLRLAGQLPDGAVKAQAYAELAVIDAARLGREASARYLAESERMYRALNNPAGVATILFYQAAEAETHGDIARADALRAEVERLVAEVDDAALKGRILSQRPLVAWHRGDYASARHQVEQLLLAHDEKLGQLAAGQRVFYLGVLGALLFAQQQPVWAARVFGMADTLSDSGPSSMMRWANLASYRKQIRQARADVRARLGAADFARAQAAGKKMTLEDLRAIPHPDADGAEAAEPPFPEPLTPREMDVLILLAEELSNPQIAQALVVSRRTVHAHLRAIYGKLGVHSRDAAVRVAQEHGLLD